MESLSEIFSQQKNTKKIKPPAYSWQELALQIIKDFDVPSFKRSSVFKICKDLPENKVKIAFNDTKELCQSGSKWQYFFKVASDMKNPERSFNNKKAFDNKKNYKPSFNNKKVYKEGFDIED